MKNNSSIDFLESFKRYMVPFVFAMCILLYGNTLNHSFALDDYSIIINHKHVQNGYEGIKEIFKTNYRHGQGGFNDGLYRPLSLVSFAIEQELFNGNPKLSHLINILTYAFSCSLLLICFLRIFKSYPLLIPLTAALLFMAHPLHTEVVSNIKGRDDLFSFFGFVLALFFSIRLMEKNTILNIIGVLLSFLFALFSKESSVLFCLAIPLILLINRSFKLKNVILLATILTVLSIAFFFLRLWIIESMSTPMDEGNFSLLNNPIANTDDTHLKWGSTFALQFLFLEKLLFPFKLIHDYSFNQIPLVGLNSVTAIVGGLVFISLLLIGISKGIKREPIGLAILLYLCLSIIASQILMPIGLHFAERMLFMPVIAFAIVIALGIDFLLKNRNLSQKQVVLILAILMGLYSFKTINRNSDWANNLSLYEADIQKAPNSARANYNLGTELSNAASSSTNAIRKNQLYKRAAGYLEKAIKIYPEYTDAINNLGIVYQQSNQAKKAVLIYLESIRKNPEYSKNYFNIGLAYFELKEYQKCIISLTEYTNRVPNSDQAFYLMGQSAGNLNQFEQAISYLNQAVSINSQNIEALKLLGMAYGLHNEQENAERIFQSILNQVPNDVGTLMNLSICYNKLNRPEEQVSTLKRLLNIEPNNKIAAHQLVLTLDALGRTQEANSYRSKITN